MSTPDADHYMLSYSELWGRRDAIFWLFCDRCVMCKEAATEVNEIVPRARTKQATLDWHNQVTLCHKCHTEFHHDGVTRAKQKVMLLKRKEFLQSMGRENFI